MSQEPKQIALAYIEACGAKAWDKVAALLAPKISFTGPNRSLVGAQEYLAVLERLGPIWVRSDVKKVFVDGPDVCVIYDLVTNTEAGALQIVEWLRVEDGRLASVFLVFDRVAFKPASDELAKRLK